MKLKHQSKIQIVPIHQIVVVNSRSRGQVKFKQIVANIANIGLKKPITVFRLEGHDGQVRYDLVCGEGRFLALKAMGQAQVAELARSVTGQDPLCGHLFLFRSRGGDRLKVLYFDADGYALWYKRLEEGVFKLPKVEAQAKSVELRASELAMMLDGIDLKSVRRVKRYQRKKD